MVSVPVQKQRYYNKMKFCEPNETIFVCTNNRMGTEMSGWGMKNGGTDTNTVKSSKRAFLAKNKRWSGSKKTYNPVTINAKYHQICAKNETSSPYGDIQNRQKCHLTVTQLFLPDAGESLPAEFARSLKIKGFRALSVAAEDFFVILAKTLANPFFLWYDLSWIRIPFLR